MLLNKKFELVKYHDGEKHFEWFYDIQLQTDEIVEPQETSNERIQLIQS